VLTAEEARVLLDAIDDTTLVGLRDRAMIATMVYTFARIGAVIALREKDVFHQQRRLWLRLSEKGGKQQQVPCHHNLEAYLDEYMAAAQLGDGATAPLFQTLQRAGPRIAIVRGADGQQEKRSIWQLSGKPMSQPIAWAMVRRRAADAGLDTAVCNHTFRATGITTYLKNGGTIERAAAIANHTSTRTTQLYDRRPDDVALDEIEKIQI
jgi:integrase